MAEEKYNARTPDSQGLHLVNVHRTLLYCCETSGMLRTVSFNMCIITDSVSASGILSSKDI